MIHLNLNAVKLTYYILFISYILDYLELGDFPTGSIKQGVVLLLLISLIYGFRNNISKSLVPKPITFLYLIIFNTLGIITTLLTTDVLIGFITLIGLNIYFILYYINSYRLSLSIQHLIEFNKIAITSGIIMNLFALVINLPLTIHQFSILFYGRVRIYGIFQQPNLFATVCFIILVATFINFKLSTSKKSKRNYIIIFISTLIGLILSDSRGALIALIIFIGTHYFMKFLYKFEFITRFLLSIITIIFLIFVLPKINYIINQNLSSSYDNYNYLTSGRLGNWETIFNNLKSDKLHYYLGYGLSSGDEGPLFRIGMTSDNGYLIWIFQAGIISLCLIILLLLNIFRVNFKNKSLKYITVPLLFSYIFYAFFENFLMSFGHIVPFYCWTLTFIGFHASKNYIPIKK